MRNTCTGPTAPLFSAAFSRGRHGGGSGPGSPARRAGQGADRPEQSQGPPGGRDQPTRWPPSGSTTGSRGPGHRPGRRRRGRRRPGRGPHRSVDTTVSSPAPARARTLEWTWNGVELEGIEPPSLPQVEARYRLRHSPLKYYCTAIDFELRAVELGGFEPPTSSMPWKRATDCAIAPFRASPCPRRE